MENMVLIGIVLRLQYTMYTLKHFVPQITNIYILREIYNKYS